MFRAVDRRRRYIAIHSIPFHGMPRYFDSSSTSHDVLCFNIARDSSVVQFIRFEDPQPLFLEFDRVPVDHLTSLCCATTLELESNAASRALF